MTVSTGMGIVFRCSVLDTILPGQGQPRLKIFSTSSLEMFHPSRGGVRGGRDQFNWDDVKNDKDRYNYLGNSLKARVKKPWDQGAEPDWYAKDPAGTDNQDLVDELEMIKARERDFMTNVISKGFGFNKAAATAIVDLEEGKKEGKKEHRHHEDRSYRYALRTETQSRKYDSRETRSRHNRYSQTEEERPRPRHRSRSRSPARRRNNYR